MATSSNPASIESVPLTLEQKSWRWRILFSTYFAYAGYYLCRKVFTICKTTLAGEFHMDLSAIAHIWTTYLVAYMIGQFINSFIGRKWGPRLLLLGGFGISIAINVVFGFANSYWTFMGFMFFNGIVQASGWAGCVGTVSTWIRKSERGAIMGVWNTNFVIANIVVKSLGGFLLASMGWRYSFFGCTLVAFGIWWLVYFWQRNKPEDVGLPTIIDKEADELRAVNVSNEEQITFKQYMALLLNPVVPLMGVSYFCLKFMRYALDSWLPAFLNLQGLAVDKAAYYSQIFDWAGVAGVIVAGWAFDRIFRGRWQYLCIVMGIGMIGGYLCVVTYGANPYALAFSFGIVGFMLYGPDSLFGGVAAMQVAGENNTVAVAAMINGMASVGPIIQEEVIGFIMKGKDSATAIHNANMLTLGMSVAFVAMVIVVSIFVAAGQRKNVARLKKATP